MEIWKDIISYEGNYKISSYGRVWSKHKRGVLDINPRFTGYCGVNLFKNNKPSRFYVHRLVAIHFIDNPNGLPIVDHINNIRDDNNVNNLRWVDYAGNSNNSKRNTQYSDGEYIDYTDEELKNEVWVDATKIIDELKDKDYFMVSNLGRYRYCKKGYYHKKGIIVTKSIRRSRGYPQTTITVGKTIKYTFRIHKLVVLCFLRKPNNEEVIDHIDSDRCNPRLSNLQIITQKENTKKANREKSKDKINGMSRHTHDDILKVYNMYFFDKRAICEIAKKMSMKHETVTYIVKGKSYKHIYNEFINRNPILPDRPTKYELLSSVRTGIKQTRVTCPHCGKTGGKANMVRHHFNNCKHKLNNELTHSDSSLS